MGAGNVALAVRARGGCLPEAAIDGRLRRAGRTLIARVADGAWLAHGASSNGHSGEPDPGESRMFAKHVHARFDRNRIAVRCLETGRRVVRNADPSFSTSRLLVGNFSAAQSQLKTAVQEVLGSSLFSTRPVMVIQVAEMIEGGLSQVEQRIFSELGESSGAAKSILFVGGEDMSDDDVKRTVADAK